jgi:hypothetical protein
MSLPMPLVVRELPAEEWHRLTGVGHFADPTFPIPSPASAAILAVEEPDGTIVGYWWAFTSVHVEPLWIAEAHRHRTGLVRRLWRAMGELLGRSGVSHAYAIIAQAEAPTIVSQATRLGFQRVPGDLYFIRVGSDADGPGTPAG